MVAPGEMDFYELLAVSKDATSAQIKKGYHRMAVMHHPDKNPENPEIAEEMFKAISEAYKCLVDDEQRKLYDQLGTEKYLAQQSGGGGGADSMHAMFLMLFGGGAFESVFGELLSGRMVDPDMQGLSEEEMTVKVEALRKERTAALLAHLLTRIAPFVANEKDPEFQRNVLAEVAEMRSAPGGAGLLCIVGYVYEQEAHQHRNRFLGIEKWLSNTRENLHNIKVVGQFVLSQAVVQSYAAELQNPNSPFTPDELRSRIVRASLSMMWKQGCLEVESTIREVCVAAMADADIDKKLRERRCAAILRLGEMYQKLGKEAKRSGQGANVVQEFDKAEREARAEAEAAAAAVAASSERTAATATPSGETGDAANKLPSSALSVAP